MDEAAPFKALLLLSQICGQFIFGLLCLKYMYCMYICSTFLNILIYGTVDDPFQFHFQVDVLEPVATARLILRPGWVYCLQGGSYAL